MMLPSVPKSLGRLSDVFISALGAITGKQNRLNLPKVKSACVILVDGLGSSNIQFRAGHAPTIANQLKVDGSIACGFPSTTVSSLASFSTGLRVGQHGMVGYQVFDRPSMQSMNLLTGIPSPESAKIWQPKRTVSEMATESGVETYFVGPAEYENSGFTNATMRTAKYVAAKSIEQRFQAAEKLLAANKECLIYLYVPELDQKAHAHGFRSAQWVEKLEDLDSALKRFLQSAPKMTGVLLTADHGVIDVAVENHIYLDELDIDGLQGVGGDPRVLYLYLDPAKVQSHKAKVQSFCGKRVYVAERRELIEAGWFGDAEAFSIERMPELFLISVGETALYHRGFVKPKSLQMIGQHGSISSEELNVPLLRFLGFAKNN
jgi:predicted AlkP superfamily pyrophosphatase or phosphodiesterase